MPFINKIKDRFWKYVEMIPEAACWYWIGGSGKYGIFSITHSQSIGAHKFSYLIHKGSVPKGFCVCHSCDQTLCVNPSHLFLGTHGDNAKDRNDKKRHSFGEQRPMSKLTEKDIKYIRSSKETGIFLAKKFDVSSTAIYHVRNKTNWKHI